MNKLASSNHMQKLEYDLQYGNSGGDATLRHCDNESAKIQQQP